MSVSPKTRPPGQGGEGVGPPPPPENHSINSGKRKMEDREASVEQHQRIGQPDAKAQMNGTRRTPSGSTASPKQPPRKRTRYLEPPIWAQSIIGRSKSILGPAKVNQKVNGTQAATKLPVQAAPPPARADVNGNNQGSPPVGQVDDPSRLLGPWEKSITGRKPFEGMTKIVADWLYVNVVSRNDLGELASRGVEVEIEAKIGQLIDKDTSQRFTLPVLSECILAENPRIGFKSSMTEVCIPHSLRRSVI
jgi:polynucleotide 5'-triphosphatase